MVKIDSPANCCGCTACANICNRKAITMIEDNEGFLYPVVNEVLCNNCALCEKVCPILKRKNKVYSKSYKELYAVRHKDENILLNSSSGGAFSAIADWIIQNDGVVYGAVYNEDMQVVHARATTDNECAKMRGSKYSQSNLSGVFLKCKNDLKQGKHVLFTGTPCQIAGLKSFLVHQYDNLYTIDLVCHAVPSPRVFADYVNSVNKKYKDKLNHINMRYKKSCGWSHSFSFCYSFCSGKVIVDPIGLSNWGRYFFSGYIDRPSCHQCLFTNFDREGDITIADFWDDLMLRPDLKSSKGTSLLMVNTEKGLKLFTQISSLYIWKISEYESLQRCLIKPSDASPKREEFWKYYLQNGYDETIKKFFPISQKRVLYQTVKKIIKSLLNY